MKQKKLIKLILVMLLVLSAVLVFWRPWNKTTDNSVSGDEPDNQEIIGNDSSDQNNLDESVNNSTENTVDPSGQEDQAVSGITILEDEGDIIIEIPDDMESDGF